MKLSIFSRSIAFTAQKVQFGGEQKNFQEFIIETLAEFKVAATRLSGIFKYHSVRRKGYFYLNTCVVCYNRQQNV